MTCKTLKLLVVSILLTSAISQAAPPNTVVLDGRPIEYDDVDLVGTNPQTNNNFGSGNVISNLFVTWDSNYVYFALQGKEVNDKLTIMVDVDPGNGTGATTTTNWTSVEPSYIKFNDVGWQAADGGPAFGLDYQIASEGFYNNVIRIRYNGAGAPATNNTDSLFDNGNGSTPQGGPVDMVVLADALDCPLKGIEARIAWSVLYSNNLFGTVQPGEVVPQGASLRVFAVLHNNSDTSSFSSDGIIPSQTNGLSSLVNGIWTTADYIDVPVDADNNGFPDLGAGDVNAPYLKYVSGVQGKQQVFAWFNENITEATATNTANWLVGGANPLSVTLVQPDAVLLDLAGNLPAAGTLIQVQAANVEDASANYKVSYLCLNPSASGIETSITVRFLLNINSGFGAATANPRATNFFVNGGAAPLEFGYPPVMTSPLTSLNATQHYRDVIFPPGSPVVVNYKYSGVLSGGALATGTNNYEAIRLDNFANVARALTLPTNGVTSLVVTDWLGTVAAPFRNPTVATNGYNFVYTDARRGDAGVRQRTTILFQLDLSQRNLAGVTRVLLQGSDPLRGFNFTSSLIDDYAGNLGWVDGGITMVDDGTLGDQVANDGIFSRLWSFTTNGVDAITEPAFPNSLVGGNDFTPPYFGSGWLDRRSPRSFKYKFFVYRESFGTALQSPDNDIEYYIENTATNIVLTPFVWANNDLPLPPPSNAPALLAVVTTGTVVQAVFTNQPSELQHGVQISTNLGQGWLDYGLRAVTTTVSGLWRANINGSSASESYRAFAGPPKPFAGVIMDPYPIPATGATVRIYYTQHSRGLAGDRNVQIAGNWTSWNPVPMTFMGDGVWYFDLVANTSVFPNTQIKFKPRNLSGSFWDGMGGGGNDFFAYVGDLRASYSNPNPTNGELLTITYDANGGPLAASTNVRAYVGFDEQWFGAGNRQMTNTPGNTNIWEISFEVPTNVLLSINFVFNGAVGAGTTWDSEGAVPPNGRQWRLFLDK